MTMNYQISYDANVGIIPFPASAYSNITVSSTTGCAREGTSAFRFRAPSGGGTAYLRAPFITPTSTPSISAWVYFEPEYLIPTTHTRRFELRLVTTNGYVIDARWNRDNRAFDIYVNGVLVKVGDPNALTAEGLFNIRVYGTIDNNGGLAVNVNGYVVAEFTGDTLPTGSDATVKYVEFTGISTQSAVYMFYVSCISLNDGGLDPGDRRVYVRLPTSDNLVQWSRSTGSTNWGILDNVPPTTAYVYTTTNGHIDKLGLADIGDVHAVNGVAKFVYGKKTTGNTEKIKNGVDSGGTVSTTENALTAENAYHYHVMTVDPNTSAAFDKAGVNALLAYKESVI